MKKVYLYGKLGTKYGREHVFNADNAVEAIKALDANFPEFFKDVIEAETKKNPYIVLTKNPKDIKSEADLKKNLFFKKKHFFKQHDKEIHIIPNPQGGGFFTTVLFTIGTTSITVGGLIGSIVVSLVLSAVMNALFKPPKPPERKDPVSTKSFLIAGGVTRQAQGIAVPLGYGTLKIGPANVASRKINKKLSKTGKPSHLESYTEVEFLDLLCEGPIEGFVNANGALLTSDNIYQSIYLNETPVQNTGTSSGNGGTFNYILNEKQSSSGKPVYKLGSETEKKILSDSVYYIKDYDTLLTGPPPYGKNNRHKSGKNNSAGQYTVQGAIAEGAKMISHFISNPDVSSITFSCKTELATNSDQGEVSANNVAFAVVVSRKNNDYNVFEDLSGCSVSLSANSGVSIQKAYGKTSLGQKNWYFRVSGIATSPYQFDVTINFDSDMNRQEISKGVTFKFYRITPELDPTVKGGNAGGIMQTKRIQLAHVVEKIDEPLLYPHSAMIKMMVDSKNFSQLPDRSYHLKLKKVLIPQNYEPLSRSYYGTWNGLFKGQNSESELLTSIEDSAKYWTDNPAWILFDLLNNPRYGVAKYGLEEENIDKWQLYKIAKYCDELVRTGYPVETKSGFPRRFSTTNILSGTADPGKIELKIHPGNYESNSFNGEAFLADGTDSSLFVRYEVQQSGSSWQIIDKSLSSVDDDHYFTQKIYEFNFGATHGSYFGIFLNGFEVVTQIRKKSDSSLIGTSTYRNPLNVSHTASEDVKNGAKKKRTREYIRGFSDKPTYSNLRTGGLAQAEQDFPGIDSSDLSKLFDFSQDEESIVINSFSSEVEAISFSDNLNYEDFIEEFGTAETFRGKKIALFMYNGSSNISDDEIAYRSATYTSQVTIEERTIISSDPANQTVVVSGPSLPQTVGACATQISHKVVEPRFSANLILTDRSEALEIIKNICSIFRGMVAYSNGQIFALQDSKKTPIQIFNNANIDKSGFSYFGTRADKKVTASLVRFNNREKNYRPDIVYEEDSNAIAKFGYSEHETMGLGITSESQARRLAKWILYTSQLETESIKFTTGLEGSYLFPGSVFLVSDELRMGRNRGGRLLNIFFSQDFRLENGAVIIDRNPELLLDKSIIREGVIGTIEVMVNCGRPSEDYENIEKRAPYYTSDKDQDKEIDAVFTPQVYTFDASVGSRNGKCLLYNLMLKIPLMFDVEKFTFEAYDHKLINGDQVIFKTFGTLPSGLSKTKVYTVSNASKHNFQVSIDGSIVKFFDVGKDELRNEGGTHYVCPYVVVGDENKLLIDACSELSIGAPYILNGKFSISGSSQLDSDFINSVLDVDTYGGSVNSEWRISKKLGEVYVDLHQEGWVFSSTIDEWMYVENIYNGGAWFWAQSFGWVAVIDSSDGVHWYIEKDDQYLYLNFETLSFFVFDTAFIEEKSDGRSFIAGKKVSKIKTMSGGVHFSFMNSFTTSMYGIYAFDSNDDILNNFNLYFDSTPSLSSSGSNISKKDIAMICNVDDMNSTFATESGHSKTCITMILSDADEKKLQEGEDLFIYDFYSNLSELNSQVNKKWGYAFKSPGVIELLDSEEFAIALEQATVTNYGNIEIKNKPVSKNQRDVFAQTFRTSYVKEISENKYEVVATEYNDSKFDTVEKVGVLKRPNIPIPPQPDMSIPEGPSNLKLTPLLI